MKFVSFVVTLSEPPNFFSLSPKNKSAGAFSGAFVIIHKSERHLSNTLTLIRACLHHINAGGEFQGEA